MGARTRPPRGTSSAQSAWQGDPKRDSAARNCRVRSPQRLAADGFPKSGGFCSVLNCCQLDPAHILESFLAKLRARRRFEERRYLPGFSRIFPDFRRVRFYWGQGYMPMSDVQKSRVFAKNSFFAQNGHRTPQVERVFAGRVFGPPNAHGPCAYVRWAVIWRVRKKPSHMSHAQHGD